MRQNSEHLQNISEIRSLMERSTRFMTLSGSSGISIGIMALICAGVLYVYMGVYPFQTEHLSYLHPEIDSIRHGIRIDVFIFILASICIILAIFLGYYFTYREAKKQGIQLKGKNLRLMVINLMIPLLTGGIFILALWREGAYDLIAASTLIFYGLALINGGKYTHQDLHQLGLWEIGLGILALFIDGYNLEFWTIGFGLLHIIYGAKINKKKK